VTARDAERTRGTIGRERVLALRAKFTGAEFDPSWFLDTSSETPHQTVARLLETLASKESSTPVLRAPLPSDESFLLALTERLGAFPVPPWRTAAMVAASDHPILLEALHRPEPDTLILIAEPEPGNPAGFIFATSKTDYFTGERHAHIEILAVRPEMERRGIARKLMEGAEEWARSRGYGQITLNVFAQNEGARRVYDRLGYQPELVRYWKGL
jgi:ribosomal protein S18 acetylase RimI-like enzyme